MKQISVYFNEPHSLRSLPPPQGCYTCRSHLRNGFQMTKELSSPSNEREGGRMPVPVSETPVTFSAPGFLLLGRQRAALPKPSPCLALLLAVLAPGGSSWPVCARSPGDVDILGHFQLSCLLRCLFRSLGVPRYVAPFPIRVCERCEGAASSPRDSPYRFGGVRWKECERTAVTHDLDKKLFPPLAQRIEQGGEAVWKNWRMPFSTRGPAPA